MTMTTEPVTPYVDTDGLTSGWSGGDSSRDRARRRDANGQTASLQTQMRALAALAGRWGVTCQEAEDTTGLGHGSISGALSNLHKAGQLARIKDRRNGQEIYLLPSLVDGRELAPYRPNRANRPKPRKKAATVHVPGQMALFDEWAEP